MATSVELRQQRARLWERMKEIADAAEAESRDLTAEEQENWNRADTDIRALDARIERQERLERAPADDTQRDLPTERPERRDAEGDSEERAKKHSEAFRTWLKFGMPGLTPEQRSIMQGRMEELPIEARALATGIDTAGGYLVPDDFRRQIESAMLDFGGMREAATVFQTDSGADLAIPTDDDTSNVGARLGENQEVTELDVTVGQRVLRAYFYTSKMIKVPYSLLQDAAFDIEGWLSGKLAERIGRKTNLDFTTGAGADSPIGIVTDAVSGVTAAAQTAVTWDELVDLEHSVDRAYRPRGRWMFHDNTLRDLKKIKDGEGRYLWQPGMPQVGAPNTLMTFPYTVNNDMPTMASGAKAILFGDLRKYLIRDVRGIQLLTLRERYAEFLQVAFLSFSRHDGKLLDAGTNPVKCITMA